MRAITDHEAFILPGGRLELLENSDEAIKREIFKIIEIKDIDKIDIRPKTINKLIKCDEYIGISHNINYDWA